MENQFLKAFSKEAYTEINKQNEEIETMKGGLAEALYISLKENAGDMDAYLMEVNKIWSSIQDGFYDFNDEKGNPVRRYLPYAQQHAILKTTVDALVKELGQDSLFDLSMTGLKKLKVRRDERLKKRSYLNRIVEQDRPRLEYAGNLNDRGEQMTLKEKLHTSGMLN